jgi:isopenicillin-N epimerase
VKELFLLDPDVTYLNHGSFGACPRPVFEEYQRLQLELERQPVQFLHLDRTLPGRLARVRARLGEYVGADPEGIVLVTNASSGVNVVARSLGLEPGDEILASDVEYGGMDRLWRFVARRTGARYVQVPVERIVDALGPRTKVFFVSHISSPTARLLPVEELVAAGRAAGALTIVDGAHAPGQLDLDVEALGADVYAGNCHKWMCAPKGAGFLSVRAAVRPLLEPAVVSWTWEDAERFADRHVWQGTRDPAAHLAVPAAIEFLDEHDWPARRERCRRLAAAALAELEALFQLEPLPGPFLQMVAARVPPCDPVEANRRLLAEHRVEVPFGPLGEDTVVRVSIQAYNDERDVDRLLDALRAHFSVAAH